MYGLLNEHRHTANAKQELTEEPLYKNVDNFVASDCVRDGNMITANGQAANDFAREVLLALGVEPAEAEKWYDFATLGLAAALAKHDPQGF
jgi:hypothetical protein